MEAALVISFVVIPLIFGIINYAFMLSTRQGISSAVAAGARTAAVAPSWGTNEATNKAAVQNAINGSLFLGTKCNLGSGTLHAGATGVCRITTDGTARTIEIVQNYSALIPLPGMGLVVPDKLAFRSTVEVTP